MLKKAVFHLSLFALVIFALVAGPAFAQTAELPHHTESYVWSSGMVDGSAAAASPQLAAADLIFVPEAQWLRVNFRRSFLGEESYLELTSLLDGATQHLDARTLREWNYSSAFFNGDAVEVKLFVGPSDKGVHVDVADVMVGEWPVDTKSICGTDDRVASSEPRVGRIVPVGCTGWIVNNGKLVTAGHCLDTTTAQTLQFNVPLSQSSGAIVHPAPQHQYSIDQSSRQFVNGGIGNDWGIFAVFNNTQTLLQPIAAQGASFTVAQNLGPANIRITGFGIDSGSANQTNQTHIGPNTGSTGTTMRYATDTQGGNSGSPVIDGNTSTAVGVHTHAGCTSTGGNNNGTSTFSKAFWDALGSVSLPTVTITATDASAAEPANTGQLRITRTGSTAAALTVTLTLSGTATNGVDYTSISTVQTIDAGQSFKDILVSPIDDTAIEGTESVILSVATGAGYTVGSPSSATVTITDNDLPTVTITATDAIASETPTNTGQLTLTRTGSTAAALTVTLTRSGTATNGADYTSISTSQTISAFQSSKTITLSPIDDTLIEGPETVTLTVAPSSAYNVGSPSAATVTITNNDYTACTPTSTRLCLGNGRFEATLTAVNSGTTYPGQTFANPYSQEAGGFWLFSSNVIEVMVKVLDAGSINGRYWVYHGSATGASYTLSVKDRANNLTSTYTSSANSFCGGADFSPGFVKGAESAVAFPEYELGLDAPAVEVSNFTCAGNSTTLCLLNNRFQVRVKRGSTYQPAVNMTDRAGIFWFFNQSNAEIFLNLHDGTPINGKYWVFFGSMTDQSYQIEVVDSTTGLLRTYSSGAAFCGLGDTSAF